MKGLVVGLAASNVTEAGHRAARSGTAQLLEGPSDPDELCLQLLPTISRILLGELTSPSCGTLRCPRRSTDRLARLGVEVSRYCCHLARQKINGD